jgi:uncharacterized membrane protein
MFTGHLALTVAALFAGAAVYVSFAEQPARLALEDRALLIEWQPSYRRGFAMQASLAALGACLGAIAWWQSGDGRWLVGAVVLFAGWPYTLMVMRPTNDELVSILPADAGPRSRTLIERWGWMHLARVGFGVAATALFLWAASD